MNEKITNQQSEYQNKVQHFKSFQLRKIDYIRGFVAQKQTGSFFLTLAVAIALDRESYIVLVYK